MSEPAGRTETVAATYARGAPIPWRLKMALKIAFGWAPRSWLNAVRVNRASHRADDDFAMVQIPLGLCMQFEEARGRKPISVLDFGPGAMVAQCVAFASIGANPIVMVEQSPLVSHDPAPYQRAARALAAGGYQVADISAARDAATAMAACKTTFLNGGLTALRTLPDEAFDFVTSSAALEHVRRSELPETLHHLHRVMRRDGYALHGIDLHDHFGGGLNSLRFSDAVWEHRHIARCGLYTNRWSERNWRDGLTQAGFKIERLDRAIWTSPPIATTHVHRDVSRSAEDLMTAWMVVGLGRTDRHGP